MLSPDDFLLAGKLTQFVSIDLLVKHDDKYLLGLRTNNPAINTYFVPGSKTHKNSSLTTNFSRITQFELGKALDIERAEFLGVFDHIYDRNYRDESYGTHYVCTAVLVECQDAREAQLFTDSLLKEQHNSVKWLTAEEILESDRVNNFTKYYFTEDAPNVFYRRKILE